MAYTLSTQSSKTYDMRRESLGTGDSDARQGGRHADTTRIRGFRVMRDLRNYGVCCYCSVGPRCAARSGRRRHAKDLVADRRSDAGLCDGTRGSDNRAGSAARATHASGNRIRLCLGRRFRASHTRSTDPHTQSRRCLPNTARNAPCGWKARRRQVQTSYHLCCGEGKTPRISGLSLCEPGAHLFAAWCSRIIGCACMRPEVLGTCHRPHSQTATGRQKPSWQEAGNGERCRRRSGATSGPGTAAAARAEPGSPRISSTIRGRLRIYHVSIEIHRFASSQKRRYLEPWRAWTLLVHAKAGRVRSSR
jgi:hypothetical protein